MYYFVERVSSQAKEGSKQAVVDTTKKEKKSQGGQTEVSYHNGCFGEMLTEQKINENVCFPFHSVRDMHEREIAPSSLCLDLKERTPRCIEIVKN